MAVELSLKKQVDFCNTENTKSEEEGTPGICRIAKLTRQSKLEGKIVGPLSLQLYRGKKRESTCVLPGEITLPRQLLKHTDMTMMSCISSSSYGLKLPLV